MFTCDLCSQTFTEKDNLKRQVNEIHYGQPRDKQPIQLSIQPSFQQQRQEAGQINYNTEISGENYELGYGITIIQGLKVFNSSVVDNFKFQDYQQQEYKQKWLQGMKIDDYQIEN